MLAVDLRKFNNQIVFFGFCPGADFSRRLDTRWKELGICEFQYFESKVQVKRFASIEIGDLIVLKKRQVIGKTMRVYGYGLVTGITKDDKGNRVLKVDWSSQEQVIEVPLLGCNATIDIRDIDKVRAEMPDAFFEWLNQGAEISGSSKPESKTEASAVKNNEDVTDDEVVEEVVFEMEMNIEDFEAILNNSPSSKAEPIDIIEIGTTYLVSNKNKKSVWNTRRFTKVNSENNIISHIVGWRSGTFAITPMSVWEADNLQAALFRTDDDDEYSFSLGESVELIETFDCCYDDFDEKKIKDVNEKELKHVRKLIKKNDDESLLEAGWKEIERYDWEIVGPVDIQKHKTQNKTKIEKSLHLVDMLKNANKISHNLYESAVLHNKDDAQYELGLQLKQLASTEKEAELSAEYIELAAWWFQSSALQGNHLAQYELLEMYDYSDSTYLRFLWTNKSAEQGNADAQYRLAELWYLEDDVPPQFGDEFNENAIKWYELAAKQGHPKAQYELGMLLLENEDDFEKALKWIKLAAEQGVEEASNQLNMRCGVSGRIKLPPGYKPSTEEEYMNPYQLEYFRQILLAEQKNLLDASQGVDLDEFDENTPDGKTIARCRKLLYKIEKILKTIDDETYGYCVDTGEEIGIKRLLGQPMAERTIEAQERWEEEQKKNNN